MTIEIVEVQKPLGEIVPAMVDENGKMCGFVHSFETGAAVDGPGMRFVVFVSGCQFRCLYCHNPDTWKLHNGKQKTVDEVVAEIGKYAAFLKMTGGLTISGGEPLMQAHFVGEIFYRVKQQYGLHTALDTQGFLAAHLDDSWFDNVDLVLLDIKQFNPERYEKLTGKPLQPTLDFARRLQKMGKKIWLRYVLVPGWSDDVDDVEGLAAFVQSLGSIVERVEVLPFHKMGEHKWEELGMKYELGDVEPPSIELAERVRDQFRARGLNTY
ncbi:pyruvate formate-lyase-activating protein [Jeongeupia chitinilytica]|uniref:Pyruvate formate-lyase-activating enzyme n=1 Tax=Jeongeupia chitinilytica TaxID=1041641 RepID=A0ABQ3GX13_9NEIS|nr:pyruvate formate-lyase-activating protein [Jeongeupia chitinilytica]GHD59311.1 pyruvate formate-lyase-activating enzyme [Jeongeupia chitinilytica]